MQVSLHAANRLFHHQFILLDTCQPAAAAGGGGGSPQTRYDLMRHRVLLLGAPYFLAASPGHIQLLTCVWNCLIKSVEQGA